MIKEFVLKVWRFCLKNILPPKKCAQMLGVKFGPNCRFIGKNKFGSEPYLISLGHHVSITSSTFITHDGAVWVFREEFPEIDIFKPIIIGNNVFIGSNCTILPGTEIGNNVIVGAGSLVTKKLDSNSVYAGIPAKKIKTLEQYRSGIESSIFKTKGLNYSQKKKLLTTLFKGC